MAAPRAGIHEPDGISGRHVTIDTAPIPGVIVILYRGAGNISAVGRILTLPVIRQTRDCPEMQPGD